MKNIKMNKNSDIIVIKIYNNNKEVKYMPRYKNNQITEVVCQIRFSTILKINNEDDTTLSEFQSKVQNKFPMYNVLNENIVNVDMSGEINNLESITPQILRNNIKNHMFISIDGKTKINLTSNFISLSTQNYECWDKFGEEFLEILDIFKELYNVNIFNRIGIRYINAFSKEELGINIEEKWNDYLIDEIVGMSSKYNVNVYNSNIEIPFDGGIQMRLICGLGTKQTEGGLKPVFIMDKDTYKMGNMNYEEVNEVLQNLHTNNSKIFEELIKPSLREKMGVVKND